MNGWLKRFTVLALIALSAVCVWAAGEAIEGVVKDNTGGVIPGVTMVLTSVDTGAARQALTDDSGFFVFSNIRPGNYELKAELEGFQPVKVTGVKVAIGDQLSYPITMTVSELTTEVEVRAEVEQVETTTSALDTVIDEKRIVDLPLNGRNPLNLVYLAPGVTSSTAGPSANGSRGRGTNYQLDGIDNNDTAVYGNVVETNVDATAEFRVITSNPSAEYGRAGGAIIDVISKSGTNEFHGNAYIFSRAENLDASTYANNLSGLEKGEFKRNQFGGSIGGPIIKDKLFFFFNCEFYRLRNVASPSALVPTQAFRDTITNPYMAQIFQEYYPLPTDPGGTVPGMNGYVYFAGNEASNSEQYTTKVDYMMSEAHSLSVRYYANPSNYQDPRVLPTTDMGRFPSGGRTQSVAIDWTWIISPTFVNNFKVGYNRVAYGWFRPETNSTDLVFGDFATGSQSYFTDFGGPWGYGDQWRNTSTTEFKDTVTWTKNTHSIKFGLDFRYMADNAETNFYVIPALFFDQYYGYAPSGDTLTNIAGGFTDYSYQGAYSNGAEFEAGMTDHRGWREREYDMFIQDDWKILPNLTLNVGLRYEWKPTAYEANNLLSNVGSDVVGQGYHLPNQYDFFDPANWSTGNWQDWWYDGGSANWVGTGSDIFLTSDNKKIYEAPKWNFAPRIGMSWDPFGDGKTALRAGWGMSYDRLFDNLLTWNASQLPFGVAGVYPTGGGGYDGILPNGAAYFGHGTPLPDVELHLPAESYYTMVVYNTDWKQPYIQTWNVSVQREIIPGHILTVAYAGSAGAHLLGRQQFNSMYNPTPELIQGISDNFGTTASVPSAVRYGLVQNSQWYQLHYIDPYVHSNYNALQLTFSRRFSQGLQVSVNYTWAKAFDNNSESVYTEGGSSPFSSNPWNSSWDRGYSAYDVRHNFNTSFIYELPFGPGKWLGGDTSGALGQLIGGWQINGIVYANTGYPLDYKVARDTLGTFYTNARGPARPWTASTVITTGPYAGGNGQVVGPTAANFRFSTADVNLFNPTGDYYRGFFRGPGYWDIDFSLFKEFKLPWITSEGSKLQLRLEAFNLFNHTNYTNPSITLTSALLGVTRGANANRQIQLGAKFIF
jgi:hypothetical protein